MTVTIPSSHEPNQDVTKVRKATKDGSVSITNRGKSAHALLSIKAYQRPAGDRQKIADLLAMPDIEGIEPEIPSRRDPARSANLS